MRENTTALLSFFIVFIFILGLFLGDMLQPEPVHTISSCPICATCKCKATDCFSEVVSDIRAAESYKDTLKELMGED